MPKVDRKMRYNSLDPIFTAKRIKVRYSAFQCNTNYLLPYHFDLYGVRPDPQPNPNLLININM